jgi:hypothetical protein
MLPIVAATLAKSSTSCPAAKLPVIATAPEASVALSTSLTTMDGFTAAGAPFSV